jgi:CRISPR/Cas system-associated exonuclease Cas4 (RecB family)
VRHHTAMTLDHLKGNPRAEALQDTLHRKLALAMGELVERVNALLGRLTLSDAGRSAPSPNAPRTLSADPRMPLHDGAYVEVWLEVPEIRWIGRADLIVVSPNGVEIVDFKTGTPADAHADQLRIYGLLWLLDGKRNPAGRPPTSLRLVYESELVEVPIPENWDALRSTLIERTNRAREKLETSPPPTRPSTENCPFCPVRALCDAYWLPDVHTQVHADMESSNFLDVALVIEAQRSPGLWSTRIITGGDFSPGETVLLVPHPSRSLRPGTELRLLGAHRSVNDPSKLAPDSTPLLTETTWTECYGKGA